MLIIGVIALVITLVFTAAVFNQLGLTNKDIALGLPEGSIRAVIALSLILIFMIISVFIYWEMQSIDIETSWGLTQNMVMIFPNESVAYIKAYTANNGTTYAVGRIVEPSKESNDIAKQIITTVSTLVVELAGFYFGTRAVSTAIGVTTISDPIIRSIGTNSLKQGEEKPDFKISGKNFELGKEGKVKLIKDEKEIECTNIVSSPTEITCRL